MPELSPTSLSVLNAQSSIDKSATVTKEAELGQADFLKLMTEQLKAQDPLNPGDTGDFLGQMAQFASVSGITGLQESMDTLVTSLQSTQALQASSLVGRNVLVPVNAADLNASGGITGQVQVPTGTSNVTVTVKNASGESVYSESLPSNGFEPVTFNWDGTLSGGGQAASGKYSLEATALSGDESIAATVNVAGRVESVLLGGNQSGLTLNVEGLGKVPAKDVIELGAL